MRDTVSRSSVLFVATLASFLTPFMASSVTIALPSIGKDFAMNAVLLGWVATAYFLAAAVFLLPFGRIADIYGRKKILLYGMVVYTISSLLSGIATSSFLLILFRFLQGTGGAMIFSTGMAIVTSAFSAQERGKALGITISAVYLGLSLGPFLGGFLTQHLGWRSIFLANVPLGLATIGLILSKLKGEWAEARGERFDLPGSIVYGLALVAVIYGLSLLPSRTGLWLILGGGIAGVVFVRWEITVRNPVLDIKLFRNNAVFAFSNLAALINYSATFAVGFLLSLYLQYIKGFSPQGAGIVLVVQPIVMTVFSPIAGRISDRVEPQIVASAGMAFTTVGLVLMVFLGGRTALPFIVASLAVLGFGLAPFSSPNTNAIMSSVEKRDYGVASATLGTMRLTGQMLSMTMAMLLFAIYIGRVQITPAYYPLFLRSVHTAFIIFSILCFGGVFASLARGKLR